MKLIQWITVPTAMAVLCASATTVFAADQDGVAIAIVYDTSGSMKQPVNDETGKPTPKYLIANRALIAIADRIQTFATNSPASSPRKIHAGLFVFQNDGARAAIPFGPFDDAALKRWARSFSTPGVGTPLGNAVSTAGRMGVVPIAGWQSGEPRQSPSAVLLRVTRPDCADQRRRQRPSLP